MPLAARSKWTGSTTPPSRYGSNCGPSSAKIDGVSPGTKRSASDPSTVPPANVDSSASGRGWGSVAIGNRFGSGGAIVVNGSVAVPTAQVSPALSTTLTADVGMSSSSSTVAAVTV